MHAASLRAGAVVSTALLPLALSPTAVQAAADSVVGDSSTPTTTCTSSYTFFQSRVADGSPSFALASDGVITSVTIAAPVGAVRAFKLGRGPAGSVQVVGGTDTATVPTSGVLTQSLRMPARAGDVLGESHSDGTACLRSTQHSDDLISYAVGNAADGDTATSAFTGFEIAVSARVEPDADHDGYGDTTQDGCPTDASTHGACPSGGPGGGPGGGSGGSTPTGPSPSGPGFTTGTPLTLGALGRPGGAARVGKVLAAPPAAVTAGATETFQWFRVTRSKGHRSITRPIAGATAASYRLKAADRGNKVLVRVTLSAPGRASASADSGSRRVR